MIHAWRTVALTLVVATATVLSFPAIAGEPLDTRTLPRLEGGTEAFSPSRDLTAYDLPAPAVQSRATAVVELLGRNGWQRYVHPSVKTTTGESVVIATFKKGPQSVRVVVSHATRDALATRITYEARPLTHDVPFPAGALDYAYDPEKPQLYAHFAPGAEVSRDAMVRDMQASGWELAPSKTRQGNPIFSKPGAEQVYLGITRLNDGRTRLAVLPVEGHHLATPPAKARNPLAELGELADLAKKLTEDAERQAGQRPARKPAAPPNAPSDEAPLKPMASPIGAPVPIPETASEMRYTGGSGELEFRAASSLPAVAAFYRREMKTLGWQERKTPINNERIVVLEFAKARAQITFTLMARADHAFVTARGSGLVTAPKTPPTVDQPRAAAPPVPPSEQPEQVAGDKLTVSDQRGLFVPAPHVNAGSERTPYRQEATARVAASLADILAFYQRELAARSWPVAADSVVRGPESANLRFTMPDGVGQLLLTRNTTAGVTDVRLIVRKEAKAKADGIAPRPGQAKIVFGNIEDAPAVVKINGKTIRVDAGVGAKEPDGPKLDLPPGTYPITVQFGKGAAKTEKVTIEADRTWGVLVGPRGILALPLY